MAGRGRGTAPSLIVPPQQQPPPPPALLPPAPPPLHLLFAGEDARIVGVVETMLKPEPMALDSDQFNEAAAGEFRKVLRTRLFANFKTLADLARRDKGGKRVLLEANVARAADALRMAHTLLSDTASFASIISALLPLVALIDGMPEFIASADDVRNVTATYHLHAQPWESGQWTSLRAAASEMTSGSGSGVVESPAEKQALSAWHDARMKSLGAILAGKVEEPPAETAEEPILTPSDSTYFQDEARGKLLEASFRACCISRAYRQYREKLVEMTTRGDRRMRHVIGVAFPLFTMLHKTLLTVKSTATEQGLTNAAAINVISYEWRETATWIARTIREIPPQALQPVENINYRALAYFYDRTLRALVNDVNDPELPAFGPVIGDNRYFVLPTSPSPVLDRAIIDAWRAGQPITGEMLMKSKLPVITDMGSLPVCLEILHSWATVPQNESTRNQIVNRLARLRMVLTATPDVLSLQPSLFTVNLDKEDDKRDEMPDREILFGIHETKRRETKEALFAAQVRESEAKLEKEEEEKEADESETEEEEEEGSGDAMDVSRRAPITDTLRRGLPPY